MQVRRGPSPARRKISIGAVVATLVAAAVTLLPAPPASADRERVTQQGTLGAGYLFVASDGGIFNYGDSEFFGSTGNIALNKPVVDSVSTPTGEGYWLVAADGGIFSFGDAQFYGSTGDIRLNAPIVGMQRTATGNGYWLVASDGGIFSFGDAVFYGSAGAIKLNKPIVGMDITTSGLGYYLVAEDGGIFTYGDARFFGSTGAIKLNQPIVGMEATDDGDGYYLVASDGGIFSFGRTADDAQFFGSTGAIKLNQPVVDMALTATNLGYWLVAADGGIFAFGDAPFLGSTGAMALNRPVVGMDRTPNSPLEAPDFVVNLRGTAEVPGPGDPDGRSSIAHFDFTGDELCYNIRVDNIAPATAAHIHEAPAGVAGPVLITLTAPDASGVVAACQDVDPAVVNDILENPEGYYVNVHNAEFPGGAVRGQLQGEVVVAATADNSLVVFNSEFPSLALPAATVTGLGTGENIVGLDYRPANDQLYAMTITAAGVGRIYTINEDTGVASRLGTTDMTLTGDSFGFDFNPVADRIRIVSSDGENLRVDPETGAVTVDTPLAYAAGDPNAGDPPAVEAAAYTNNRRDATATVLYDIDRANDVLVRQDPPNNGTLVTIGPLGVDATAGVSFDIAPAPADEPGTGIAVFRTGTAATEVYAINYTPGTALGNTPGKATLLGALSGDTPLVITAITIA